MKWHWFMKWYLKRNWYPLLLLIGITAIAVPGGYYLGIEGWAIVVGVLSLWLGANSLSIAENALSIAKESDGKMTAVANLEFDEKASVMEEYLDYFSSPVGTRAVSEEVNQRQFLNDLRAMTHVAKWADKKKRTEARQRLDKIREHIVGKVDDTIFEEVKKLCDQIWSDSAASLAAR